MNECLDDRKALFRLLKTMLKTSKSLIVGLPNNPDSSQKKKVAQYIRRKFNSQSSQEKIRVITESPSLSSNQILFEKRMVK